MIRSKLRLRALVLLTYRVQVGMCASLFELASKVVSELLDMLCEALVTLVSLFQVDRSSEIIGNRSIGVIDMNMIEPTVCGFSGATRREAAFSVGEERIWAWLLYVD